MVKIFFYKIQQNDNDEFFYIGSTVNISSRKSHHRKNVNNKVGKRYWTYLYLHIRKNGGWTNFTLTSLESGEYDNRKLGMIREQEIIDDMCPTLNSINCKTFK
jgi:hypothetical protein